MASRGGKKRGGKAKDFFFEKYKPGGWGEQAGERPMTPTEQAMAKGKGQ